jgi:hypothetical protein
METAKTIKHTPWFAFHLSPYSSLKGRRIYKNFSFGWLWLVKALEVYFKSKTNDFTNSTKIIAKLYAVKDVDITMNEAIYLFAGAVIAGLVGLFVDHVKRCFEEKRTKERIYKALLPEVQANQFYLEPFYRLDPSQFPIPCNVTFDRTIYSSIADKIGLLDILNDLIDYYAQIHFVERLYANMSKNVRLLCLQNKEDIEKLHRCSDKRL